MINETTSIGRHLRVRRAGRPRPAGRALRLLRAGRGDLPRLRPLLDPRHGLRELRLGLLVRRRRHPGRQICLCLAPHEGASPLARDGTLPANVV